MTLGVMILDVLKLSRVFECRHVPVQVAHPLVEVRISGANITNVALEMLHIHRIEANNRGVQTNISLRNSR